jgi:hypothetical protein
MQQVELYTSDSGSYVGGKWKPYVGAAGHGKTTAAQLSAMLHGQAVVKFEVETHNGDDEVVITFSSRAKLHISARHDTCHVDYRVVGKP